MCCQECFDSLLKLLNWSWNTFCAALHDTRDLRGTSLAAAMLDLERLVYVSTACLRLINVFINQVYPNQGRRGGGGVQESSRLAECIGDTRDLLKKILVDSYRQISFHAAAAHAQQHRLDSPPAGNKNLNSPVLGSYSPPPPTLSPKHASQPPPHHEATTQRIDDLARTEAQLAAHARSIIDECHQTFVASFHAFYPSTHLKWNCLCDLLNLLEPVGALMFVSF